MAGGPDSPLSGYGVWTFCACCQMFKKLIPQPSGSTVRGRQPNSFAGLAAFRIMRKGFPHLPAIFLTNRVDFDLGRLDDRTLVVSKRDTLPQELLDMIRNILPSGE